METHHNNLYRVRSSASGSTEDPPVVRQGKGTVDLRTLRLPDVVTARLEWLEALQQPWKLVNYQGEVGRWVEFGGVEDQTGSSRKDKLYVRCLCFFVAGMS